MKKLISLSLVLVICFSLCVPAFAADIQTMTDGYILDASGRVTSATLDDLDDLILKRNQAVLRGDEAEADRLLSQIYSIGSRPSTSEEIATTVGTQKATAIRAASNNHVSFNTVHTQAVVNGQLYVVNRVDALVSLGCNLYHTASVSQRTVTARVQAGVFAVCKTAASAAISVNPTISAFVSVYDALLGLVSGLTPTTVVDDIKANWVVACIEQCSFFSYKNGNQWVDFGTFQYITTQVTTNIIGVTLSGGRNLPNTTTTNSYNTYKAGSDYQYSAASLLTSYFGAYIPAHIEVTAFHSYDQNGGSLKAWQMVCPHATGYIY